MSAASTTGAGAGAGAEPEPDRWPWDGAVVTDEAPLAKVLRYDHCLIATHDVAASVAFYDKLGFDEVTEENATATDEVTVLRNGAGFALHVVAADEGAADNVNLLMDDAGVKPPGHTHLAFKVPNVAAAKAYLESCGIEISGERGVGGPEVRAVFCRDPSRTVNELERNFSPMVPMEEGAFTRAAIGCGRIDHVGTRVRDMEARFTWCARGP
uniref:VOC domain-containing protein n=1 Tax=Phaeomonas parva TaxID=124430 RepID=A0A7S1U283_9STRA